ncbi:hypothetical protein OG500_00195 [Kitasatospora sp. NBC_01250]|uniref:hypothetical protein n=1 Tax=Kitasatospora sp. NBC_01250 TaxID=2903571 RepID=UPI002E332340|nr:hypothetical protein [Kitasatospora sp. NBC_01250]
MRHQSQLPGWTPAVPFVALGHPSWIMLVLAGVLAVVVRQLAEWQRRRTLVALVERSTLGTVVEQESGMGGPGMRVQVGTEQANGTPAAGEGAHE